MAFDTDNLAKAAFKKLFGKAHTGPPVGEGGTKDLPNESVASRTTVAASDVYGEAIPLTPPGASTSVIRVCTTGIEGELDLTEDGSSNGNTYYVTVPVAHDLTSYTNPETGSNYVAGERVQNIIPASFGGSYRPIIKDNGTEVPPTDASDWFLDDKAGTLTSETDLSLSTTGTIACYVYVGDMVEDLLGGVSTHSLLDATVHTDTATQTVSRGSLIVGDSTPEWNEVTIGTDQQSLVSDGTDAAWGVPGVTSVVTVGKGGAVDYNTVQGAVDYVITQTPSTSNRFVIHIYKGTYVEDVDMTGCPYTNLHGVSRSSNDVTIQTTDGTAIKFDNSLTPAFVSNIQIFCSSPTSTTGICVQGYGIHVFDNCLLDVSGSTAGAYARYAVFPSGIIQFNSCRFQSNVSGTSAGAATYALVEMTGTAFAMNNTSSLVNCGDVDDNITFLKINSVSNRISIVGCLLDFRHTNASQSGNFTMFDVNQGSAQMMYISGSDLNVQGNGGSGTATMIDMDSTTNDGYMVATGCNAEIKNFGTNYVAQVATGDTLEVVGCHVSAADEWTGAGTVNFASLLNDDYVLSPVDNINQGNQAWGSAAINSNRQVNYAETYTGTSQDGLYFTPTWTPSSSETGDRASIAGYSILGNSSNWAGSSLSGLNFGTWNQGSVSAGSATLEIGAINVFAHGGIGGTTTAADVYGIKVTTVGFTSGQTINCDNLFGIKIEDSSGSLLGTQTNHYSLYVENPTDGTNQFQVWLNGSSTGSGVFFNSATDRIYNDGTDFNIQSTADLKLIPGSEVIIDGMKWPTTAGTNTYILQTDGVDQLSWVPAGAGSGDVTAASNLGDNLLIRGDGAVKGVQNSGITISDADAITGVTQLTVDNLSLNGNSLQSSSGPINLTPNTAIEAGGNLEFSADNRKTIWGAGNDVEAYYDGSNFVIDHVVGSGYTDFTDDVLVQGHTGLGSGSSINSNWVTNLREVFTATSGTTRGLSVELVASPASTSTGSYQGIGGFVSAHSVYLTDGELKGLDFGVFVTSNTMGAVSNTLDVYGIRAFGLGAFQSICYATNVYGLHVKGWYNGFGGNCTATNVYAIYADNSDADGSGTITNQWGIYVESPTRGATKNQAIEVQAGGQVGIGGTMTNSSCGLELQSTTQAVMLSRMTTTQRNALTAVNGMIIYNSTTGTIQGYTSGSWSSL